jgi:hypothetical protein
VMMWITTVTSGAMSVSDVQTYLAFAPWRSAEAFDRWYVVISRGVALENPATWGAWSATYSNTTAATPNIERDRETWMAIVREAVEDKR